MSNLIPFQFENSSIRVVAISDTPWFVAKDICSILMYANPSDAVKSHCKRPRQAKDLGIAFSYYKNQELAAGLHSETVLIPESDVYRLVIRSRLPEAQGFENWVFEEVLPSIRKTGSYSAVQPPRHQPTALDVADWVLAKLPNLCERSRQEIVSRTANQVVGFEMLPLPKVEERFWTAGELAEEFGCTANKIGRLANAHELKTEKYGEHRLSKSKHSTKQVEQFYYNEKGRAALARLVLEIATH